MNPVFVGMRFRRRPTKKGKLKDGFPISASKSFYLGCERGEELAAGFTGFSFHFFLVIFFVGSISSNPEKQLATLRGSEIFLSSAITLLRLESEIVTSLRERCPDGVAQIELVSAKPGDVVKINEGPFSGLEAIFEKKMKGSERVAVLLDILGRQTRLVLPSETIEKI